MLTKIGHTNLTVDIITVSALIRFSVALKLMKCYPCRQYYASIAFGMAKKKTIISYAALQYNHRYTNLSKVIVSMLVSMV